VALNYTQSFDGLNNGDLNGQDNWYGVSPYVSAVVEDSVVYAGTKAIEGRKVGENCISRRDFSGSNPETHWSKFVLRTSNVSQNSPSIYLGKSAALHASIVAFRNSYIQVYNGNGSGGGSYLSTGVALVVNTWYVIKVKLNHSTQKWDIYVNDMETPKLSNIGFRYNTSDSINFVQYYSWITPYTYMDEFSIHDYDPDAVIGLPITNKFHSVEESGGFLIQ
jgi:hypothetical protein